MQPEVWYELRKFQEPIDIANITIFLVFNEASFATREISLSSSLIERAAGVQAKVAATKNSRHHLYPCEVLLSTVVNSIPVQQFFH